MCVLLVDSELCPSSCLTGTAVVVRIAAHRSLIQTDPARELESGHIQTILALAPV
jgi:hypothetical protein